MMNDSQSIQINVNVIRYKKLRYVKKEKTLGRLMNLIISFFFADAGHGFFLLLLFIKHKSPHTEYLASRSKHTDRCPKTWQVDWSDISGQWL